MVNVVHELKLRLLKDNNIFGDNAYYYNNSTEFKNGGVSDIYSTLFYIRPLNFNPGKHKVKKGDYLNLVTSSYRAVFQLPNNVNCQEALESLYNQIDGDNIKIKAFSDDSLGIYFSEHQKQKELLDHFLISIDFDVEIEYVPSYCKCLNIEEC